MHHPFRTCSLLLLLALSTGTTGCGGGGGDGGSLPPVGPRIGGSWVGQYYARGASRPETPLTATIRQDGDAVFIRTSLVGVGANLTGTIEPSGDMSLIDGFDGEIWTTHFRPATSNFVQIADFLRPPEPEDTSTPVQIIELNRAL